jgi:response regulator NasT
MDNILLVCKEQAYQTLKDFLCQAGYINISWANCASKARRLLNYGTFSLCIIDTPLSDESSGSLALYVAQNFNCPCLLLVMSSSEDDVAAQVEDYGIMVISKPINRAFFYKMIKFALSSGKTIYDAKSENKRLQQKLEELKIVTRAKLVLMEKLKMTETEAHKHIEKQAMDLRATKREVAQNIIRKYEINL